MRRNLLYVIVISAVVSLVLMGGRKMLAQSSLPPSMIVQPVDESQLVTLRGNVHPLARAEYDRGIASSSMPMNHLLLVLKRSPEQETALETFIAQQADKNSPNYQKWLTPVQFGQQFGASDEDVDKITSWLQSHGLQVNSVANGRNMIDFSGNAGEIQEAFHTEIHHYVVNGADHFANATAPQIPAALAPIVAGVNSLNDFRPRAMHRSRGTFKMSLPSRKITRVSPSYTFADTGCYGTNTACYGVGAYDFATIYNLLPLWNAGYNGTGEKITIVSDSDITDADYVQFRTLMGLPAGTVNTIIPTGLTDPGIQNCTLNTDEGEAILDVEWAGATAPGATIDLVIAPSAASSNCGAATAESGFPFGGDYAAQYALNQTPPDPILSDSYGECELFLGSTQNAFYNTLWQQANTEGVTVLVATGDNGSAGCDNDDATSPAEYGLQVNGTASTPYDTAVGGTDFDYISAASTYWTSTNNTSGTSSTLSANGPIPETAYNDSCTSTTVDAGLGVSGVVNACNSETADEDGYLEPAAGSGGFSACTTPANNGILPSDCAGGYAKPSWQTGSSVPADSHRDIPDLSLFAGDGTNLTSETFYIVCEEDQTTPYPCGLSEVDDAGTEEFPFVAEGGTSVAAQAMAGIVAVLDQYQSATQHKTARYGSMVFNTQLYTLSANESGANCNASSSTAPASTCVFRDITVGTNSVPCATGTTNCGTASTTQVVPTGRPDLRIHWTPQNAVVAVCVLCAIVLLLILPGRHRRFSPVLALLLVAIALGAVSCGGGSSTGTVNTGGGGSTDAVGVLTGYNSAAGYDRATGLGSLNVSNFVKANGW